MELMYITSAFFLGAIHALEPGHGKIVLMTYVIGTKRRYIDAFMLASVASLTHIFSIIILGILTGLSTKYFLPPGAEDSMEKFGGLLVLIVGIWMIYSIFKHKGCTHSHHVGKENTQDYKKLIMLGISGGLIPCPTALAVLSAAVASGNILKGIFFILAYGFGIEILLFLIGLLLIRATGVFESLLKSDAFENNARKAGAFLVTFLGVWLILK